MPIRGCSPMSKLVLAAALGAAAVTGNIGCNQALKGSPGTGGAMGVAGAMATGGLTGSAGAPGGIPGSGGARSTGGVQASGGARAPGGSLGAVGGARSGAGTDAAGGASGGSSGTDPCAGLAYDYCVDHCLTKNALRDTASCTHGSWTCRSGYVLASSCPSGACAVTPDACCDLTTGVVSDNPCSADGYRAACGDGSGATYGWPEAYCVPSSLGIAGGGCYSLNSGPCSGPAIACSDMSIGSVDCHCDVVAGSDASTGTWHCSAFIGP